MGFIDYVNALAHSGGKSFIVFAFAYWLVRLPVESLLQKDFIHSMIVLAILWAIWLLFPNGWDVLVSMTKDSAPTWDDQHAERTPEVIRQLLSFEFWGSIIGLVVGAIAWEKFHPGY